MSRCYLFAYALCVLAAHTASATPADFWRDQNIYQIVTDRFFNGDPSNDNAEGDYNPAAGQGVHGGDWKGIEQKLDYIKALGATAIWISPIVLNGNGDYHGYAGRDFYKAAPHFGSLDDLKHLIATAHAKGLLVIDDVVVNHGAQLLNSNDNGYPNFRASPDYNLFYRDNAKQYAAPFDVSSGQSLGQLFHGNGFIQDFSDTNQVERGFLEGLDDFRTEGSYVQTQMANIYKFWMDQGFDAFRIDTVKHVDHAFWQNWAPQIRQHANDISNPNFFTFGEVYDRSEAKCGSYTGTRTGPQAELDSTLDYPLYYAINSVFALGTGNTRQLNDHFAAVDANYDAAAAQSLVTFVDNHDQPRFLNVAASRWSYARLELALAFIYTSRGIPCLYYGTEQGFNGGNDPNNREDMFAGQFEPDTPSSGDNFDMTRPVFQWVATMNNLRRLYPALRTGSFTSLWNNPSGPGIYAYARHLGNQEVIVAMNTSEVDQTMPACSSTYASGTVVTNVLGSTETVTITNGQFPSVNVPALTTKIYVAQAQSQPLDPLVSYVNPVHDAKNVATVAKISVAFTHPMDTTSVESAFTTVPVTSGRFSWSSDKETVTYQAIGGFPSLTTMIVQINTGATDSTGKHLLAPFQSQFRTGNGGASDIITPSVTITSPQQDGTIVDYQHGVSGSATDNVGIDSIEEQIDNGPWLAIFSRDGNAALQTVTWNAILPFQYTVNGLHTISVRATDTSANISDAATVSVRFFTKPGPYEQWTFAYDATNVGQSGCDGEFWLSTPPYTPSAIFQPTWGRPYGYIGGSFGTSNNSITNVCYNDQLIYTDERYCSPADTIRYVYQCPPGVYQVTLHEAETFMSGPNQRRFDVYLQGEKSFSNIDIFAAAGGSNRAVTFSNQTTVTNGQLEVLFKPVYDYARSSGIHVKKIADLYSDSDGIPDWWRLGVFGHATGLAADSSRAGDDPDGDGQTNLQEYLAGTDPLNVSSALKIIRVQRSGTDMYVTWSSASGTTYQLQRSDSLTSPNWINVGSPVAASGSSTGAWDPGGANRSSQQFYHVVAAPQ